jgi:uncharacterized protein with HEPN domain
VPESGVQGDWITHLDHMIVSIETLILYAAGLDREVFQSDRHAYDATLRNLKRLGEAATRVPNAVREASPQIPWQRITTARDLFADGEPGLDEDDLWSIVQAEVPALLASLRDIRAQPPSALYP